MRFTRAGSMTVSRAFRGEENSKFRILFQELYDITSGSFFNFKTTDVYRINFFCINKVKPVFLEEIFCAMIGDEGAFAAFLYETVTAAIVHVRRRDRAGDSFFFNSSLTKYP